MGRIVVGVDGSANARTALEWALDQARQTGSTVEAVMTWTDPYAAAVGWGGAMPPPVDDLETVGKRHEERLAAIIEDADTTGLSEPVEQVVTMGGAASTLLEVAEGADLLVVGSRGHGGFMGLLLGSVSQQIVSHARCPVVVVPSREGES